MVRFTDDLVALIDELEAGGEDRDGIVVVVRGPMTPSELDVELTRAVDVAQEPWWTAFEANEELPGGDPGEWSWASLEDGVLLVVEEADSVREALGDVVEQLSRQGVEGTMEPWTAPDLPQPPHNRPGVICQMRLAGARVDRGDQEFAWRVDDAARTRVAAAGVTWVRGAQDGVESVAISGVVPIPVAEGQDPLPLMLQAVEDGHIVLFSASDGVSGRAVSLRAHGGVGLAMFGPGAVECGCRAGVDEFRLFLERHAPDLVYGHVMATVGANIALRQNELPSDWPRRAHSVPRGVAGTRFAFEDLYAPDAFAVQLLGPGYRDRALPETTRWRRTEASPGSVLLEHAEPDQWLSFPTTTPDARPIEPALLQTARDDLHEILYRPGVLSGYGIDVLDDGPPS